MPSVVTTRAIFCLGDSITLGGTGGETVPWPQRLRLALAPDRSVGNLGVSGATIADMATLYATNVQGQGFVGCTLLGGINDINGGATGAATLTAYQNLVTTLTGDGLKVLCLAMSPCGAYAGWNGTKQGYLDTLNAGILALSGPLITTYDTYTFMGEPGTPTDLRTAYSLDGLHWLQAGIDAFYPQIQATLAAF